MSWIYSMLILIAMEGLTIWCMYKQPLSLKPIRWHGIGKSLMYLFITDSLVWMNAPCVSGMKCRHTWLIFSITAVVLTIISLLFALLGNNKTYVITNLIMASAFPILYCFNHEFCIKPDMRCIIYTKPNIIMYSIALGVFALVETGLLTRSCNSKNDCTVSIKLNEEDNTNENI